ncbi:MAG: capsule assembly Wzi family protein [Bacteroidota bacterium]
MRFFLVASLVVLSSSLFGQSPYVLPGTLTDEIADRWDILYGFEHEVFASQRNTARKEIVQRAFYLKTQKELSDLDKWDIRYINEDNNEYSNPYVLQLQSSELPERKKVYDSTGVFYHFEEFPANTEASPSPKKRKGILGHFYKTDANFFELNTENFELRVNPILNLRYGEAVDDPSIIFQNTRGAEVRGLIDNNVYFYSRILENQAHFNNYREDRIERFETIGGQGFFKEYDSGVIENLEGHDFLNAQAYVGVNATKSVAIEFGHGRHFIGHGMRSLLLSDYATNYFYLKFNTRIWKFHYQNVFAELAPISTNSNSGDRLLPKKYMANHYLSFRPTKNIEIGIFEAIVFSREDRFEFQYLNPIILYRSVEQLLDSPDNALIGLNGKWNIKNRIQFYGQLMLDEFKLSELRANDGWWANKFGIQAGLKYINVGGIDHLDAQLEYNRVRPFTYTHTDTLSLFPSFSTASYSHHSQPLAHPLGANFQEMVLNLRYRLGQDIFINGRLISAKYGQNPEGGNLGSNILLVTDEPDMPRGHFIGQGIATNLVSFGLDISYHLFHNCFLDLNFLYRKADADLDELDIDTRYIGGGLRVNLGNIIYDY